MYLFQRKYKKTNFLTLANVENFDLNCTYENEIKQIYRADKFPFDSCRCDYGMSGDKETLSTQSIQSKNVLKNCQINSKPDNSH